MLEIERTFLVKKLPADLKKYKSKKIRQGYISDHKSHLRIRQIGEEYELTKKALIGESFTNAQEDTIYLTVEEFDRLWPTVFKFMEKTRYYVPILGGLTAEVDVFEGKLEGLCLVDVEFNSEKKMNSFKIPNWFGRDVTQEEFSSGRFLAGKSFTDIRKYL